MNTRMPERLVLELLPVLAVGVIIMGIVAYGVYLL